MKKSLALFFLLLLLLTSCLTFSACTSKTPLYTQTAGTRTYAVYGSFSKPTRIEVSENGAVIWKQKVSVNKSVGARNGTYGFAILDLNFDGYDDMKIAIDGKDEQLTERIFLQDPATGSYTESNLFEGLCTLGTDPAQKVVFSFHHTYQKGYDEEKEIYTSSDITTAYTWENGGLVPYRRVSLTYYSERNIYRYSVSDYNRMTETFYDSDDDYLSPEKFDQTDFGFLYYFK